MNNNDTFESIQQEIIHDPMNEELLDKGYFPVYSAGVSARIMIVGQAPGRKAQESMRPWNDASGVTLRRWLGITEEQFYDPDTVALVPMDFFYPGKGQHGDLPPRKGIAEKWHPRLLALMPNIELIILVGAYAQKYYLGKNARHTLTETVQAFDEFLPQFLPIVHPSPLNFRWRTRNPWFEEAVVPVMHERVHEIIGIAEVE